MINARDLRLGNLVLVNDIETKVESMDGTGINIEACGGYYAGEGSMEHEAYFEKWNSSTKHIMPIPLTPEWLERFGFEYCSALEMRLITGGIIFIFDTKHGDFGIEIEQQYKGVTVKYVHHLQNLFFFLTGEELELKKEINTFEG